jgi:hypothetical protein
MPLGAGQGYFRHPTSIKNPRPACRERELKENFQWTLLGVTAASGGALALQQAKERFGFEQRLVNCVIAFWCVLEPPCARLAAGALLPGVWWSIAGPVLRQIGALACLSCAAEITRPIE